MLTHLRVRNLAVLRDVEVAFGRGLNVLTGETGAGKSILVDAVGLLMGARASSDDIRTGAPCAIVEGRFSVEAPRRTGWEAGAAGERGELTVRREVMRKGANRVLVNGEPVSLAALSGTLAGQVVMHGQNRHLTLATPESQRRFLDRAFPGDSPGAGLSEAWKRLLETGRCRQEHLLRLARATDDLEDPEHLVAQVDGLQPFSGEVAGLEKEISLIARAVERRQGTAMIVDLLEDGEMSASVCLGRALRAMQELVRLDQALGSSLEKLEGLSFSVQDIVAEVRGRGETAEVDGARLDAAQARLAQLQRLERRYGMDLDSLLERVEEVRQQLGQSEETRRNVARLAAQEQAAAAAFHQRALAVGKARRSAADLLAQRVNGELPRLGLGGGTFAVEVESSRPGEAADAEIVRQKGGPCGYDRVSFLFKAHPEDPLRALSRVASGGELSRLLLALTLVSQPQTGGTGPMTCIFDEVDAGIGGEMARLIGERLKRAARGQQVICVSHLPQIAALADRHLCVRKRRSSGRVQTQVENLDQEQREVELARMLGGGASAGTARRHARALLLAARGSKEVEVRSRPRRSSSRGRGGKGGQAWA